MFSKSTYVGCVLVNCNACLWAVLGTLHWHMEHSVPCLVQAEPLKRVIPYSSTQVLVMSFRTVSAMQGSVTQRGQHSPSGTTVNSQSDTGGHGTGQQSTSPCWETHTQLIKITFHSIMNNQIITHKTSLIDLKPLNMTWGASYPWMMKWKWGTTESSQSHALSIPCSADGPSWESPQQLDPSCVTIISHLLLTYQNKWQFTLHT